MHSLLLSLPAKLATKQVMANLALLGNYSKFCSLACHMQKLQPDKLGAATFRTTAQAYQSSKICVLLVTIFMFEL